MEDVNCNRLNVAENLPVDVILGSDILNYYNGAIMYNLNQVHFDIGGNLKKISFLTKE